MKKKSYLLANEGLVQQENLRLEQQALAFWRYEEPTFKRLVGNRNECLLDFGCGNGTFTSLAGTHFDRVIGVDIHDQLLKRARLVNPEASFTDISSWSHQELLTFLNQISPSIVILRFVVQHFTETEWELLKLLGQYCVATECSLLIIDCDDNGNRFVPSNHAVESAFENLTSYIQDKGGNRKPNNLLRANFSRWCLPSLEVSEVALEFSQSNREEFDLVLMPGLRTANPSLDETKLNEFFVLGGKITMPIFYHVLQGTRKTSLRGFERTPLK